VEGFNIFTNSLLGTTIQDGGMRERSDVALLSNENHGNKIKSKSKIRAQSIPWHYYFSNAISSVYNIFKEPQFYGL